MSSIQTTYVSASQFTFTGNDPRVITDRRVEADCGEDGKKYGTINNVSYDSESNITTVTLAETVLTENLTFILIGDTCSGPTGSLPRHTHTNNEQGGLIEATGGSNGLTIYSGNDQPGTGSNVLGSDGAYIWNEISTGKRYLVSVVSNNYKAVEMT